MSQPPPSSMPKLGPEGQAASGTPISDTASVPSVAAAPALPTSTQFTWHGSPWALTGACLINAILMVLTVGIYGFWGRTEIRRRMWSSVRLNGEPLAYHGTPQELLKGFFAVMLVVLVPLFLLGIHTRRDVTSQYHKADVLARRFQQRRQMDGGEKQRAILANGKNLDASAAVIRDHRTASLFIERDVARPGAS